MKPTDKGYYRPFDQTERDCRKCRNLIEIKPNGRGIECIRCKVEPDNKYPYVEGIRCARYEECEDNGKT